MFATLPVIGEVVGGVGLVLGLLTVPAALVGLVLSVAWAWRRSERARGWPGFICCRVVDVQDFPAPKLYCPTRAYWAGSMSAGSLHIGRQRVR